MGGLTPVPLADLLDRSSGLESCPAWNALKAHAPEVGRQSLRSLLDQPARYERFSTSAAGLHLDYSRQRVTGPTLDLLHQLAAQRNLPDWIRHLFAGSHVNSTERRPALHMALRRRSRAPLLVQGADVVPQVELERGRMLGLAERVASGEYPGHDGRPVTHVVNIGIGGSDLGLVMAAQALAPFSSGAVSSHFVSNIDGTELADVLSGLDPARTLFIICSKSFTTLETQLNADAARSWLLGRLPAEAVARHFVAVSVNDAAMDRFGIAAENRFRIWDWVGGRYSLWSSVGLALAMVLGPVHFRALLDGAADMDEHFQGASVEQNMPATLGLLGVWNQNFLGAASHAVLPYSQRLSRLPAFLQQLEMESNGKSVTHDGRPVAWQTGTVIWGEAGSNAQHAFFQLLHQGTAGFSADFVAPVRPAGGPPGQHRAGLANMLAQAEAMARGRTAEEVRDELSAGGATGRDAGVLVPHKCHPGNHPSSIILMESLDPRSLGALIALYEHKVFVQSVIWGINPFDQWGVELGKVLARTLGDALSASGDRHGNSLPGIASRLTGSETG